ncbi:oxidoreductase [Aromatoleum toluvorans]|uniref:Oxidoreductase n=1 Tax=Aromatoleum toluvorans TaxID=92002 RepID=A0ABX1Q279_9RHOO|nr:oxidoreductase [Aromatoleum toluvorans]NMG45022.1 oxidoreductase [Aromatoleum toluvorans]
MADNLPDGPNAGVDAALYAGLAEIAAGTFPKRCAACGRSYRDVDDYVAQTQRVGRGGSGLKQAVDDDGQVIVELFRNCVCGSTLMEFFHDRRDVGEAGLRRRARFDELIGMLVARGLERERARTELLKLLRGERSAIPRARPPGGGGVPEDGE